MKLLNRMLTALLVIMLLVSILPENLTVDAQEDSQNQLLAQWSFDKDTTRQPDQAVEANSQATIETNADAVGVSTPAGHESPNFGAKGFSASTVGQKGFTTTISTLGYENIRLSSKQRSSNTGPQYFTLQYRVDEENWKDVGDQYEVKNNWTAGVRSEVILPSAAADVANLDIRWVVSQDGQAANPSNTLSSGGLTYIDDIVIIGDVKGTSGGEPGNEGGTSLKVTFTANSKGGNYWWSINKDSYVFKPGDYVEYDVFLFNSVSGLGGVEIYTTGSPVTSDFKFREQFKAGEWVDQDGYLGIPSTDISSKAYGKWYHRKLKIPESAVGTTLRDFTVGIDKSSHNDGETFTAYYDNIAITNNDVVVKEIYTDGDPKANQRVSPASNTSYDVEIVPMTELEGTPEPLPPGSGEQDGDIESHAGMYSILLNVNHETMKANSSFNTTAYTIKNKPVLVNGTPYIPLIDVMDKIGASVAWDGKTQTATIRQAKNVATLKLGSSTFNLNGAVKALDDANGRLESIAGNNSSLMVPAGFIKNFGATVSYFPASGNIKIVSPIISVSYGSPNPTQPVTPIQIDPNDIAHRFVFSSDSQGTDNGLLNGTDDGTGPRLEAVLAQIKTLDIQPEFIIGGGDLVSGSMSRNVEEQNTQLDNFRARFTKYFPIDMFLTIPGNHEIKGSSDLEAGFAAKFPEFTSREDIVFLDGYNNSVWYYDIGDTRIFGLNTSHPREEHAVINKQYDFVKDHINGAKKSTIFIFHEPAFSIWKSGNAQERNRAARNELWELIETAPNPIVFVGHEHLYARRLINHQFNETINGKAYNFDKQIYQIHVGGFGAGTNGTSNEYKGVVTYPEAMGVSHFAIVDLLKDGKIHVQSVSYEGVLLDSFIQSEDDVNTTYSSTMTLDRNAVTLQSSEEVTLAATLASNTSDKAKTVQWSSSDESIATVDTNGKVTAVGHGEAYIVATAQGGMFAASKVTVWQAGVQDPDYVPRQLTMHIGSDASTGVNFAWTTNKQTNAVLKVNKTGESQPTEFNGTGALGAGGRYFHKVEVTGLTPGTSYSYTAGEGANTLTGTFTTAPEAGNGDSFKFNFITDPQISNAVNSVAAGAVFDELKKISDSSFTYIGGDLTDTAANETQWELFFNNGGAYPTAGTDFLKNNLISVVQGNHDNAAFNGHINVPDQSGGAYAFDYGPAKFVMLNTQNITAEQKAAQETLLRSEAAKAKENGQWIFVGMHKAIYTGASHITDADIIDLRKYWSPIFAELDIDIVMQGHDHVFSRGFVTADGANANPEMLDQTMAQQPDHAPFYIQALTAGGLKWYGTKNYTISTGDPLTPDYKFLDVNSAKPAGDPLNVFGPQSDVAKETAYVTVAVTPDSVTFNTYLFKYDQTSQQITKMPYLYDTYTIKRTVTLDQEAPAGLSGAAPTSSENNDGKITGTSAEMEYRRAAGTNWTAATGNEITGLTPGTYQIRYAAKEGYNAGAEATVIVPAYSVFTLAIGEQQAGGAGYTRDIHIGGGQEWSGKYLIIQFTEGTGVNAKVSVVMVAATSAKTTVSYQKSETKVDAWLVSGMPDLVGEDMNVQVYAYGSTN
ncbi:putative metallophosphoesterase [Paenibacillus agaridevorans]|uniref:Putative metallophosphoesterase n=1 Tax=Paenibacillus agaridevorans TaxID=171404 RepID=A0A2R5F1A9_9BACL|nr:metallophosphoesterase [Paenibacillus agaridevorans]GBG11238.1 putative metallophosphoesterase [Paenibacillus agaridevorans]